MAAGRRPAPHAAGNGGATPDTDELRSQVEQLQQRVQQAEERRRALINIMGDLHLSNRRLGDQRKAMLHILDYEDDRSRLARQTERLDNSRRRCSTSSRTRTSRT